MPAEQEPMPVERAVDQSLQRLYMRRLAELRNYYMPDECIRQARFEFSGEAVDFDVPVPGPSTYHQCDTCRRQWIVSPPEALEGELPFRQLANVENGGDMVLSPTCIRCESVARETRARVRRDGRRFGVEIEFNTRMDSSLVAELLRDAGLAVRDDGYTHDVHEDEWKIVSDGSVEYGWELVSPPLLWKQRDQIRTACETLSRADCYTSNQCGLHVHHEVADLSVTTLKRLAHYYHAAQSFTDCLVEQSRRTDYGCQWAAPFTDRDFRTIDAAVRLGDLANGCTRYKALNLQPLVNYGTVEFRQHEGTLDHERIIAWIAYGQAMVQAAIARRRPPTADDAPDAPTFLDCLPFKCETSRVVLKDVSSGVKPIPVRERAEYDDGGYDDGGW